MKLILITSLLFAGSVYASPTTDTAALARSSGCMVCHAIDRRLVGPSFREISARYATHPNAVQKISATIRDGGGGRWGPIPMPANTRLTDEQVRQLAVWSLGHR